MALEFSKVVNEIDQMGQTLAERSIRQRGSQRAAGELLNQFAAAQDQLRAVAESPDGQRSRCASPGDEQLNAAFPAPELPELITLVAADGSQIYPDRHGLAFYYVINIGSIVFRRGTGQAPDIATEPRLAYTEDDVYPGGHPATGDLVSAHRDLEEMRALADKTLAEPADGPPRIALADGSLLPWLRASLPEELAAQLQKGYLESLDQLRAGGAIVVGFVSRPRSAEVVTLLYMAHLEEDERHGFQGLHGTPFQGLADRGLFGFLNTGERSALFVRGTQENQNFRQSGHQVHFFYLNTGNDLARVEVPEWVSADSRQLDLTHAAVYWQCQLNNGYPYVLTRADEEAVILGEEREMLETLIAQAMMRHGLPLPELSRKAQQKQVARWRRKR